MEVEFEFSGFGLGGVGSEVVGLLRRGLAESDEGFEGNGCHFWLEMEEFGLRSSVE